MARLERRHLAVREEPLVKTGFRIRKTVVDGVREVVRDGEAKSQNEFVERAVIKELDAVRKRRLYEAYEEAASDPAFLQDMSETTAEFDGTSADGLND